MTDDKGMYARYRHRPPLSSERADIIISRQMIPMPD